MAGARINLVWWGALGLKLKKRERACGTHVWFCNIANIPALASPTHVGIIDDFGSVLCEIAPSLSEFLPLVWSVIICANQLNFHRCELARDHVLRSFF